MTRYLDLNTQITARLVLRKSIHKWPSYGLPKPESTSRLAIFEHFKMGHGKNVKRQIFRGDWPNNSPIYVRQIHSKMAKLWLART